MSMPLTDRITALTASANAVTGESDTTLTDAVGRLCEGYGGDVPWKRIVLESDYYNIGITNLMNFLGIDETDVLNGRTYFAEFLNNNYDQPVGKYFRIRFVIFKVFDGYDGEINALAIRGEAYNSNIFGHAANTGWGMTSGTIVNVYRL